MSCIKNTSITFRFSECILLYSRTHSIFYIVNTSELKQSSIFLGRPRFDPWVGKISWRRKQQPTPVLLPGKSYGWKSLVGYSAWDRKESDTTERLHFLSFAGMMLTPFSRGRPLFVAHRPPTLILFSSILRASCLLLFSRKYTAYVSL